MCVSQSGQVEYATPCKHSRCEVMNGGPLNLFPTCGDYADTIYVCLGCILHGKLQGGYASLITSLERALEHRKGTY